MVYSRGRLGGGVWGKYDCGDFAGGAVSAHPLHADTVPAYYMS